MDRARRALAKPGTKDRLQAIRWNEGSTATASLRRWTHKKEVSGLRFDFFACVLGVDKRAGPFLLVFNVNECTKIRKVLDAVL